MSIIATTLLVLTAQPAPPRTLTAEQALAASRAKTSIGPDPCRKFADEEEIVVCGRREDPYALPLYDPTAGDPESVAGGSRTRLTSELRQMTGPCASQASTCRPPPVVNLFQAVPVLVKGIKKLIDGE